MRIPRARTPGTLGPMRRWLVGGALFIGGCVDKNPEFVDTTPAGETGMTTSAPPATDSAASTEPETTSVTPPTSTTGPATTTSMTSTTTGPDTEGTLEVTGEPVTTDPMSTSMPGECGDGKVDVGEECDDGNPEEGDGCLTSCVKASCGDGFLHSPVEECDDGNMDQSDDCLNDCTVAFCGDFQIKFDEKCDDGNVSNDDGCEKDCQPTVKIVFVTSKPLTGAMGGLPGADKACKDLAGAVNLPGTYKAWLSINTDWPDIRMAQWPFPYVRPDGAMIAENWGQLVSGDLLGPIDYTEKMVKSDGAEPNPVCGVTMIHTNTTANGKPYMQGTDCLGWTSQSGASKTGSLGQLDGKWTESCYGDTCKYKAPIYCVQQ